MSCLSTPLQKIFIRLLSRLDKVAAVQSKQGKVVYVTSASGQEGKTFMATALARQAAAVSGGRVLLVDANMSTPGLPKYFPVQNSAGLSDVLTGVTWCEDLCLQVTGANLHVMPVGLQCRPGLLFNQRDVDTFLGHVRERFDLIIIDADSITSTGANSMASLVDGLLLVVDATTTRREVFEHALRELKEDQRKIIGAVLNKKKHYLPRSLYRRL